jgi:hypothetical protein
MDLTQLVLYAYDGSGVGLRARCTIVTQVDETFVRIRLTGDNADAFKTLTRDAELRGNATGDDTFIVPVSHIYEPGTYAPLASFNWLD